MTDDIDEGFYVLFTRQHAERRVLDELEAVHISAYLAQGKRLARHARQTKVKPYALLPRMLFVWLQDDSDYHTARNTFEAEHFLRLPDRRGVLKPWRLPTPQVLELQLHEEMGEFDTTPEQSALIAGQKVRAICGKWQGHDLTLAGFKPDHRASVTMVLFGKASQPFDMDIRHLEAA